MKVVMGLLQETSNKNQKGKANFQTMCEGSEKKQDKEVVQKVCQVGQRKEYYRSMTYLECQ